MMKQKAFLGFVMISSLFVFTQCGQWSQPKPKPSLDIVYLNVDHDVPVEALTAISQEFAKQHEGLIINSTSETVAPDESYATILEKFRHADVIIYPSKLISTFESRANSFYPLSATETNLNQAFLSHFQSPSKDGVWSLPLGFDPVIMAVQKQAVRKTGDEFFPRSWSKVLLVSELCASDENYAFPHLTVMDKNGYGLTDTLAAFYLATGLFYDVLTGKGFSPDMEMIMHENSQYQIIQTLPQYMTGNRESVEFGFQTVKSWDELLKAKGWFTFLRYSEWMNAPKEMQDQYFMGIAPNPYDENPVLCYSVNTSVSLESDQPELAKEFIYFAAKAEGESTGKQYATLNEMNQKGLLPESYFIVIRNNGKTLHEKAYFDCVQKKTNTLDFSSIWMAAYNVIHEKSS